MPDCPPLTEQERATYEWQMLVRGFGPLEQEKLKAASVLVSRVGGVGGAVAYELAAAGIGRLILAHAGKTTPADLNRQLLMTHANLGSSRVACAARRLRELNPSLDVVAVDENVSDRNADQLVGDADLVVDCAPLFEERFALNRAAVEHRKPMVECPMYELECHLTTIVPGQTPCLACLWPTKPPKWTRQFPVFGAVAGTAGCMAAMEAIKLISGLGTPLLGRLLSIDLFDMTTRTVRVGRRDDCPVCAAALWEHRRPNSAYRAT